VVNLEEPGLRVLVQEDVEAQDLETQTVLQVVRFRCSICMRQRWLSCYQSLQDDILDALPYFLGGDHGLPLFKEMFPVVYGAEDGLETAFVADIVPLRVSIKHKLHRFFVYRVICQMHHHVC